MKHGAIYSEIPITQAFESHEVNPLGLPRVGEALS